MTGILLIDKPAGPTSHDVVARIRRATKEKRIGHTGTLDPRATGLLPLVLGPATRLAGLLTGTDKTYEAVIRLGLATTTDDGEGEPVPEAVRGPVPPAAAIDAALAAFRGTFDQRPPAHSAKKVAGRRAYDLARRDQAPELAPVPVTVRALDVLGIDGDRVRLRVTATAGFYVRALARDLGEALGCGGHLESLRRTASGTFQVADAIPLEDAERLGEDLVGRVIPPAEALPFLPEVRLTAVGLTRARHGNPVGPEHLEAHWLPPPSTPGPVKVLGPDGALVALAHSRGGALHPAVVLG